MGTMIQQYKLGEQEYRGERFAGFVAPAGQREIFLKGNNELLTLTQPQIIQEIHAEDAARTVHDPEVVDTVVDGKDATTVKSGDADTKSTSR